MLALCLFSLRHGPRCLGKYILVNIGLLILRKVLKKISFSSQTPVTFNKHVDRDYVFLEYDAISLFRNTQSSVRRSEPSMPCCYF